MACDISPVAMSTNFEGPFMFSLTNLVSFNSALDKCNFQKFLQSQLQAGHQWVGEDEETLMFAHRDLFDAFDAHL